MSLRKIAGLLAAAGIAAGLVGSGVGASFTSSLTAQQNINVGTFSCIISNAAGPGVSGVGTNAVTFTSGPIESSAAGSVPVSFTVQNTGSIDQELTITAAKTGLSSHFSGIPLAPASPQPLAGGASLAFATGIQWTTLTTGDLGVSGSITWTVACNEAPGLTLGNPTPIFDNTSAALPLKNPPSWGPQAYSFNEWGGGVTFAGSARNLNTATVTMSSWACETGAWSAGDCLTTTPGATYNVPITFTLYNVGPGNVVGTEITHMTQVFPIPYRPSGNDPLCPSDTGAYWDGTSCVHGLATKITFNFPSGTTLPATAIFGISFDTSNSGYAPLGAGANPTDSLNIGTFPGNGVATEAEIGTWLPDDVSTYVAPRGATTMVGLSPVTNMPTGSGDNFPGYMPAVQITAN